MPAPRVTVRREAGARGGALRAHRRACEAGRALRPWHRRSRRLRL